MTLHYYLQTKEDDEDLGKKVECFTNLDNDQAYEKQKEALDYYFSSLAIANEIKYVESEANVLRNLDEKFKSVAPPDKYYECFGRNTFYGFDFQAI